MPRISRQSLETSYFHVITQGIEKQFIFNYQQDIKYYIKLMYKFSEIQQVKIIAYCIMNNHAHMLINSESIDNLSKFMQRLNTSYGKYYNAKYNRVGFVFRDRYKSEGIYSEKQIYNCINYIYNNPVKAGICSNASEYPFSNYKKIPFIPDFQYSFIDVDDEKVDISSYDKIIKEFLDRNNIDLKSLKKDNDNLRKLIIILKEQNLSLRKIAQILDISREKIRQTYTQKNGQ